MPDSSPSERRTPRSRVSGIDRTLQIVDMLSDCGQPTSAYAIARSVGAPVSTVYALVDDLVARGVLMRPDGKTVWIGPRLFRYGLAYESGMDLLTEAKREMNNLASQTGETVQICIRDEAMMVVAGMADGEDHFRVASKVGSRVPLNWTASGRLLVGHLPDGDRAALFAQIARPSPTGRADVEPHALSVQAGADFQRRLAVQMGASDFAVACIAAPIRDARGACAATISIVLAEQKVRDHLAAYSAAVQQAAAAVEKALGRPDI